MPIVRQLPELYLRGALANVTMVNLTPAETKKAEELTRHVADHPSMIKHRNQFIRELRQTIGGDYRDSTSLGRQSAEQEYFIAVWRAVVNLYFHKEYTFRCRNCKQSTYMTKRGKPHDIDRVQMPCPSCECVEVTKAGETNLVVGSFMDITDYQTASAVAVNDPPECASSIEVLTGANRYPNPDEILNDPQQVSKVFGEFVWNYFRQQIRENSRVEHGRTPQKIIGSADEVIVKEICCLCAKMRVQFNYCDKTQPELGIYHIQLHGLQTPPEFTAELVPLLHKATQYGIRIAITETELCVHQSLGSDVIEAYVVRPEHVMMLDDTASSGDEAGFSIDHVSFKTVGTNRMDQEDHIGRVEFTDVMDAVLDSLPDGHCQKICQLCMQEGELYERYSAAYGNGLPKQTHMAEFLGITTRSVKQYMGTIKMVCLANNLVPQND